MDFDTFGRTSESGPRVSYELRTSCFLLWWFLCGVVDLRKPAAASTTCITCNSKVMDLLGNLILGLSKPAPLSHLFQKENCAPGDVKMESDADLQKTNVGRLTFSSDNIYIYI